MQVRLPPVSWTQPIWVASHFLLRRNLAARPFPHLLSAAQLEQTSSLIQQALTKHLPGGICLGAEEMNPLDREFLLEHFSFAEGFTQASKGQAFFVDAARPLCAFLNIRDHLEIRMIDCAAEWEGAWNRLSKLDTALSSDLAFAYHPQFGYLTADPGCCGTALTMTCVLHLPALAHGGQLKQAFLRQKEDSVIASGWAGDIENLTGDLVLLRNRYTLGVSEEMILRSLHSTATQLASLEEALRLQLRQENNPLIKDQISRAFGLTRHSYQLQTKEALDALSLMKLGLSLNWINGITEQKLNELFFCCQRAHLCLLFPETSHEELPHRRAEFLHKELQGVQLTTA